MQDLRILLLSRYFPLPVEIWEFIKELIVIDFNNKAKLINRHIEPRAKVLPMLSEDGENLYQAFHQLASAGVRPNKLSNNLLSTVPVLATNTRRPILFDLFHDFVDFHSTRAQAFLGPDEALMSSVCCRKLRSMLDNKLGIRIMVTIQHNLSWGFAYLLLLNGYAIINVVNVVNDGCVRLFAVKISNKLQKGSRKSCNEYHPEISVC